MKNTRLFQQAGSPLIQGRSKAERPFWVWWVKGCLVAVTTWVAGVTLYLLASSPPVADTTVSGFASDLIDLFVANAPGAGLGIVVGSAVGVAVARGFGAKRPWVIGALFGLLAGFAVGALTQPVLYAMAFE